MPSVLRLLDPADLPALRPAGQRLLIILIDGLSNAAFEQALTAGRLSRIQEMLASRPSVRSRMLSTFPSATSPATQEMLTGRWAELDTPDSPAAVHAFDRERRRVVRYVTTPEAWSWPVPTLFDAAKVSGLESVSVFEAAWDGPTRIIPTRGSILLDAALDKAGMPDWNGDRGPTTRLVAQIRGPSPPDLAFLVLNAWDLSAHFHGPGSPEAQRALEGCDALVGEVLDALGEARSPDGAPLLERTTVLLLADHGMVESGRFIDLVGFFAERDAVALDVGTPGHVLLRERLGELWTRWPDVILVAGGSNVTQVYLRQRDGDWSREGGPRPDKRPVIPLEMERLAADLAAVPGVAQAMFLAEPGVIAVHRRDRPPARVLVRGEGAARRYAYVVADGAGDDPLGYLADARVRGAVSRASGEPRLLSREEWLDLTIDADYPGAVPLLAKAFHLPRFTGDLILTAERGFTFLRGQRGDHGNLDRDAMLAPFALAGPGVRRPLEEPYVRVVDVAPTAAVLLGADPRDEALRRMEGRVLSAVTPVNQHDP